MRAGSSPSATRSTAARASGPCTASIAQRSWASVTSASNSPACSRNQARSFSWFDALVTVRKRSGPSRYVKRSSRTPPSSRQSTEYWAPRSAIFATSFESSRWRSSSACGPLVSISPICETSNMPALFRTATCSWRMPSYCTGISQPANGTSLAPARSWRSNSGVRRRVSAAGGNRPQVTPCWERPGCPPHGGTGPRPRPTRAIPRRGDPAYAGRAVRRVRRRARGRARRTR